MSSPDFALAPRPLTFQSEGYQLHGMLHLPAQPHPPIVVGSHGLFSDGNSPKQITLAAECNRCGIAYFRFHHRGCGDSDGDFEQTTTLKGRCKDLLAAIEAVRSCQETGDTIGVFGSSMGGATAIAAAATSRFDAMVTLAAPVQSAPILEAAKTTGELRDLPLSFYEHNLSFDLTATLPRLSRILVIHGENDTVVPVSNAYEIHRQASAPKDILVQPGGDHRVTLPDHQAQFVRATVAWFRRWLVS